MPLTNSDILLGNYFLKQFGSLNINYQEDSNTEGWSMNPELIIKKQRNNFQVFLKNHTDIPPHSMLLVKVATNIAEDVTSKAWIEEPSASLFTKMSQFGTFHYHQLRRNILDKFNQQNAIYTTGYMSS